jgi:hypothetical protein
VRIHKTSRVIPAMAAGVNDRLWSMEDVVAQVDAAAPVPAKRGPCRKRQPAAEISNCDTTLEHLVSGRRPAEADRAGERDAGHGHKLYTDTG